MNIEPRTSRIVDRFSLSLAKLTPRLWIVVALFAVYAVVPPLGVGLGAVGAEFKGFYIEPALNTALLLMSLIVAGLSLWYPRISAENASKRAMVSLSAWTVLLLIAAMKIHSFEWFEDIFNPNIPMGSIEEMHWYRVTNLVMSPINIALFLAIGIAFMFVLQAHRRLFLSNQPQKGWKPVWSVVMAVLLVRAFIDYGIFVTTYWVPFDWLSEQAPDLEVFLGMLFTQLTMFAPWLFLFIFAALASGTTVVSNNQGFAVRLAPNGLTILSVRWRRVISVRRVTAGKALDAVIVERGLLPLYRYSNQFSVKKHGIAMLEEVLAHAQASGARIVDVALRLKPVSWGRPLVAIGLLCSIYLQWTTTATMNKLAESPEALMANFSRSGNFLYYGSLTVLSATFIGLGFGFMFGRSHAQVRPVPMLGIGIAASMLYDPLMYWLVYIAIYAILNAILTPISSPTHIPIHGMDLFVPAMWLVAARVVFAVGAYIVGVMTIVRPWYRALPSWPYRLTWLRRRATVEQNPAQPVDAIAVRVL